MHVDWTSRSHIQSQVHRIQTAMNYKYEMVAIKGLCYLNAVIVPKDVKRGKKLIEKCRTPTVKKITNNNLKLLIKKKNIYIYIFQVHIS